MSEEPDAKVPPAAEDLPVPAAPAGRRPRSFAGILAALVGVLGSVVYILNPGFGLFELLPDNLPGIGNLDEAGATALMILGLRYLFRRPSQGP